MSESQGKFSDLLYYFLRRIYRNLKKRKARRNLKNFYKKLIDSQTTCIDIGANRGSMTELMLCAQKIIAVEPQRELCDFLRSKFKDHSNIEIVEYAVSNKIGKTILYLDNLCCTTATVSEEFAVEKRQNYQEQREVITTTLKELFRIYNLTVKDKIYLKIDAENHEKEILSTIPFLPNNLSFEIHGHKKQKMLACLKILDKFGEQYTCNIFIDGSFSFKKFVPIVKLLDCVFEKKDNFVADVFIRKKEVHDK